MVIRWISFDFDTNYLEIFQLIQFLILANIQHKSPHPPILHSIYFRITNMLLTEPDISLQQTSLHIWRNIPYLTTCVYVHCHLHAISFRLLQGFHACSSSGIFQWHVTQGKSSRVSHSRAKGCRLIRGGMQSRIVAFPFGKAFKSRLSRILAYSSQRSHKPGYSSGRWTPAVSSATQGIQQLKVTRQERLSLWAPAVWATAQPGAPVEATRCNQNAIHSNKQPQQLIYSPPVSGWLRVWYARQCSDSVIHRLTKNQSSIQSVSQPTNRPQGPSNTCIQTCRGNAGVTGCC